MELDRFIPRQSPIHAYDARLKLLLALGAIVSITLLPMGAYPAYLVAWLALAAASTLARLGPWRLVRGSWIVLPFVLVTLPLLFTRPGEPIGSMALGPLDLAITQQGVRDVSSIALKSWLSVQVALLLAYTTPIADVIEALRSLRVPAIIVSIIGFMVRYLTVISAEAERMDRARASRSAGGQGAGPLVWRARVTGSMVGSLFIRSYERSERVHAAMLSRGFDGVDRRAQLSRPTRPSIVAFGMLLLALSLFATVSNLVLPAR
jgi:cobalt/nickel transport system permease protein